MKQKLMIAFTRVFLLISVTFMNIAAFAQEKAIDVNVDIDKDQHSWYANPWVWIVAAGVFILLLAAILRGGSKTSD